MAAPKNEIVQVDYRNPHASLPLIVPVLVLCNTPEESLIRNIRTNGARDLGWLQAKPAHEREAIIVGGGASIDDHADEIRERARAGTVFALNGASGWLRSHGVPVDYQVILDAKKETAQLVDPQAEHHLFASQVHPDTVDAAYNPMLWHLEIGDVETYLPAERTVRGGYALIGGGASVGVSALCVAYALGYRKLHIFGYDSCHRDGKSHAYPQPMNDFIPTVSVSWGGETFVASVAMRAQAERFLITAAELKHLGCSLSVYGDGLLQTMYRTPAKDLSEREKYTLMWQTQGYREFSPGELAVESFVRRVRPDGLVIDFGCGTGRAGLALNQSGIDVLLIDFASNCRDEEAMTLPFLEWDLTQPCPARAKYGYCTDVMEHIPTDDVEAVISNIMTSVETGFFQISTVEDQWGGLIGHPLHLTVRPHEWWLAMFGHLGFDVTWAEDLGAASQFVVRAREGQ